MEVISVANAHQALLEAGHRILDKGVKSDSRNGGVIVAPGPWTTVYREPEQRVIFWVERDANPFFHLAECVWMYAGRNDVAWISEFSSNIAQFSDDGKTFNGAYGERWRGRFGFDQLTAIVDNLIKRPNCRRQVLTMWSADDLCDQATTKDVPCNTQAFFQINPHGFLDMMVVNRSNDMVWGTYGANAVHFSFLLEVLAARIGVPSGIYTHVSMNTHVYERHWSLLEKLRTYAPDVMSGMRLCDTDPYAKGFVGAYPVVKDARTFDQDCRLALEGATRGYSNPWFPDVFLPMVEAWRIFKRNADKNKRADLALQRLEGCRATDWALAGREWLERRKTPRTE